MRNGYAYFQYIIWNIVIQLGVIAGLRPGNPERRITGISDVSDGLRLDCRVKPGNDERKATEISMQAV